MVTGESVSVVERNEVHSRGCGEGTKVFILIGPSGVGKSTVVYGHLSPTLEEKGFKVIGVRSTTTRPLRMNEETDALKYQSVSEEEFSRIEAEGGFFSIAPERVDGARYGYQHIHVEEAIAQDRCVVIIDTVIECLPQIRRTFSEEPIVYLYVADLKLLEQRLRERPSAGQYCIDTRLARVPDEIRRAGELQRQDPHFFPVLNQDRPPSEAADQIIELLGLGD